MKNCTIVLILICLLSANKMRAQTDQNPWAPVGATWIYRGASLTSQLYIKYQYQKDTLVLGKNTKKIRVSKFEFIGIPPNLTRTQEQFVADAFLYGSNDSVFWYNNGAFQLLYFFNAASGSSWDIQKNDQFTCTSSGIPNANPLVVNAVRSELVAGRPFSVIYANPQPYWSIGSKIVKNIGSTSSFLPVPGNSNCPLTDIRVGIPEALACYQDNLRGTMDILGDNVRPCSALLTSSVALRDDDAKKYVVTPNPAQNHFRISGLDHDHEIETVRILDLVGREYIARTSYRGELIDVEELPASVYVVVIKTADNRTYAYKLVKARND